MVIKIAAVSVAALFYYFFYKLSPKEPDDAVRRAWPKEGSRNMKDFVLPDIDTTIYEPKYVCSDRRAKNEILFLLIIVHSATGNFKQRATIRNTWGSYSSYIKLTKLMREFNERNTKEPFVHENNTNNILPDFKLVFLLGLPSEEKDVNETQNQIKEESTKYGDIVQENFVDTYLNLSVKSVIMLKWLMKSCDEDVQYILKVDDDEYVNLPLVIQFLRRITIEFELMHGNKVNQGLYEMYGHMACRIAPATDLKSKWYAPPYMYDKPWYPCFMSGWGYIMSYLAASVLYEAALRTPVLHIEDVYITGVVREETMTPVTAVAANSRLKYDGRCQFHSMCAVFKNAFCHKVNHTSIAFMHINVLNNYSIERCEAELKKNAGKKNEMRHFSDGENIFNFLHNMIHPKKRNGRERVPH